LAEDDDIEQDSEAYRKWRSGNDNDKYASSKAPSETGSRSGSYTIPKDDDDEYALPGEDDTGGGGSWLDGDMNWPVIIAALVVFALISSTIVAAILSSIEPDTTPSEWPSTEGIIVKQYDVDKFITEEYCEDQNDDGYLDDWECWKEFVYQIGLVYNYTLDSGNYTLNEDIEFWESAWVDDIKREGEDKLFQEFINATDERIALNSTVKITYNPENGKNGDAYSEFVELPEDPLGFVGWFLMCCGGFLCIPIIIVGIIMSWAKNAAGMGGYNNRGGWGPFGGYGSNNGNGGRNRGRTRRSGGTSRSGGGGRSGSGSRGGGGRSGGGGRRR